MKFTLSLFDYIQQYTDNQSNGVNNCPVCYERVITNNTRDNMTHILECYKEDLLMQMLNRYKKQHNELPGHELLHMVDLVQNRVKQEMLNYCVSNRSGSDLVQY